MKIVGLVSSYREGRMLRSVVDSMRALDHVCVFEGPVDGNPPSGPPSELPPAQKEWHGRLSVNDGAWASDAAKRTAMVEWVQRRRWLDDETWALWVDGDELLIWGEYLHDWVWRVSQQGDADNPVAGWPIPLVELDGTVSICMGKLVRVDLVRRYLISSSYVELINGERVTVGNVEFWNPVDGPLRHVEVDAGVTRPHWRARPPLAGEPHLQHRPVLRSKLREVERQHVAEERNFEGVELA